MDWLEAAKSLQSENYKGYCLSAQRICIYRRFDVCSRICGDIFSDSQYSSKIKGSIK